jgi:hypothetical protein
MEGGGGGGATTTHTTTFINGCFVMPYYYQARNLVGDGEVGGASEEGGSVGQRSAAFTVAHGELNLVQTRLESLVLRGVGLKVELDAILAGGEAGVDLTIAEGLGLRGDDGDLELAGSSLVEDGKEDVDLEGGSLGAGRRGGGHLVELGLATIVNGACVEKLENEIKDCAMNDVLEECTSQK